MTDDALGLRSDADENDIKKKFRELAKKYHPDAGGDAAMFIELMDDYKKLIGKGK
jgi:curved DNA-binding protein CbpA